MGFLICVLSLYMSIYFLVLLNACFLHTVIVLLRRSHCGPCRILTHYNAVHLFRTCKYVQRSLLSKTEIGNMERARNMFFFLRNDVNL
jgi:hypothetical protein